MESAGYNESELFGPSLTHADIRLVARQQFIASAAVAVVIALGVGLMAVLPSARERSEAAPHRNALVQQPTFSASVVRTAAVKTYRIELP